MNLLLCALAPRTVQFKLPPWMFWAIWAGFLGLFALMLYAAWRQKAKRRQALEQLALENGFLFSEKPDEGLAARLAEIHFNIAQLERNPRYSNVLQGSAGGSDVIIADRTDGSGNNRSTTTIFAFQFKTPLPQFQVFPENAVMRMVEKFGYSDIDFDWAPDFSRRFFLHGKDEAAVRTLFKPEVTQAFEQLDAKTYFVVNGSGSWLVFSRPSRLVRPEQIRENLQQAEPIAAAIRRAQSGGVFR